MDPIMKRLREAEGERETHLSGADRGSRREINLDRYIELSRYVQSLGRSHLFTSTSNRGRHRNLSRTRALAEGRRAAGREGSDGGSRC